MSISDFIFVEKYRNVSLKGSEYTPVDAKVSVKFEMKLYSTLL